MVKIMKLREQEQQNFFAPCVEIQQIQQQSENEPKEKSDRKVYFKEYNDRMKEKRKLARLQKQNEREQNLREARSKYYGAEAIKILRSLKEYTELNKEKRQLWLDFNWTLQDCQKSFDKGYADIIMIMKLGEVANNLVKDYWESGRSEAKQKGKSWNVLSQEEKDRLIKYWGRKKANVENGYIDEDERLERQSKEYEKEIEIQKHHEERGKIKCECWQCEAKNEIKGAVKKKLKNDIEKTEKEIDDYWGISDREKGKCENCYKVKKLDSESGLCKTCSDYYN